MRARRWWWPLIVCMVALGCEPPPPSAPPLPTLRDVAGKTLSALPAPPTDGLTREIPLEDLSGHALDRLGEALVRAARHEGVARLVFYGGSHTASDLYTGEVRARLQRQLGDAGHGFLLAAMPITQYWQWGAQVEDGEGWDSMYPDFKHFGVDAYGLAGIAFDAHIASWAAVHTDHTTASHVEVMYVAQPGGGTFEVRIDDQLVDTVDTAAERVEAGLRYYAVADAEHRVEITTSGEPPVRVLGFVLERETDHGVVVDQLGLAGSKARLQLFWERDLWRTLLATRRPDLIALSYGNNEGDDTHLSNVEHVEHFRQMLVRVREDFPSASCLVIGPSDRQLPDANGVYATPALILALRDAQRAIAAEHGCAFFDTVAWQGGEGAVERWLGADPPLERDDRIHFTEAGYRRLGVSLLRSMATALRGTTASAAP
jgi:lysophospholipase L1-like esterase